MKQKKLIYLFLLMLYPLIIYASNISEKEGIKANRDITNLIGKNLLAKVGSICYETTGNGYSVGTEIFLTIKIGKEYITITEKEVQSTTKKESDFVENTYGNKQRFLYKIKDNKIVIDYKNNKSLSDYKLLYLEFKDKKIIGHIKAKDNKVEFWEDLTSIYKQELEAQIDEFKYEDGDIGYVFMRVKIIGDNIFFSTGVETPPCGTIEYDTYKQYSYTQQKDYIKLHFTSEEKKIEGYKLLLLSIEEGEIWGSIKMMDNKIKQVKFIN